MFTSSPHTRGTQRADTSWLFDALIALTRVQRSALVCLGLIAVFAIAGVDLATSSAVQVGLLYHLSAMTVAWAGRPLDGVAIALLASGLEFAVRLRELGGTAMSAAALFWFLATELILLLMITIVIPGFRDAVLRLKEQATVDPLTGLLNTSAFKEAAEAERQRASREQFPLTIAFLDLDGFKEINDRRGHSHGDSLLRSFAEALRQSTRPYDLVGRLGGDEFVLCLPRTDEFAAATVIGRLRRLLAASSLGPALSASAGIATYYTQPDEVREMIRAADRLMYEAKAQGPGRTIGRVLLPSGADGETTTRFVLDIEQEGRDRASTRLRHGA